MPFDMSFRTGKLLSPHCSFRLVSMVKLKAVRGTSSRRFSNGSSERSPIKSRHKNTNEIMIETGMLAQPSSSTNTNGKSEACINTKTREKKLYCRGNGVFFMRSQRPCMLLNSTNVSSIFTNRKSDNQPWSNAYRRSSHCLSSK